MFLEEGRTRMRSLISLSAFILIVLLNTTARSQIPDSLTVEEAVRQVVANHPLVEQASHAVEASLARVEQSRSSYYPTSDVNLGYVRLGPVAELAFPGLGEFKLFPENNYDEHISLKQTVYDFGKTSSTVELKQQTAQAMTHSIALTKTTLAFQTIQTFYSILFLRQSIEVQNQQIAVLNQHLVVARKKVQAGTATDFDLLTTQVRIAAAQNRRYDLLNDLHKQEATFRRLLGLSRDAEVRLRGEFTPALLGLNVDSLMDLAQQQRIELKQSRDEEQVAELQEQVASHRDMPTLKINLAYGVKNGYIPNLDVMRGNWVVGLDVDVPIFNGFRTHAEEEEALANRRVSEARTSDSERLVASEVQQAVSDVRTSADKIETSTLQVEQARKALDIATVRYESGVITNLDLIDAETALAQARLGHLQALFDYVISSTSLDRAVGNQLFD